MKSKQKRIFYMISFFIVLFIMNNRDVYAIDYNNLCDEDEIIGIMQILGYVIQVLKIVVPMIIIVLGMVDFGKAMTSNDDKSVNKAASSLIRRIIIGAIIFFVPTIVFSLIKAVGLGDASDSSSDFYKCTMCMLKPGSMCD